MQSAAKFNTQVSNTQNTSISLNKKKRNENKTRLKDTNKIHTFFPVKEIDIDSNTWQTTGTVKQKQDESPSAAARTQLDVWHTVQLYVYTLSVCACRRSI